jgi:hypothetical protein
MFTVLSNTRKTNLYLIIALTIALVVILSLAVVPTIAAPRSAVIPVTGVSEYADYFQRHPELSVPAGASIDTTDYFVRHPELLTSRESIDLSDYFLRH